MIGRRLTPWSQSLPNQVNDFNKEEEKSLTFIEMSQSLPNQVNDFNDERR